MGLVAVALRREPIDVFASLAAREPGVCCMTVPDPIRPVTLFGCRPADEVVVDADARDPIAAVADAVARLQPADSHVPFPLSGGVVACLSYEAGRGVAPKARTHPPSMPIAVLRRYDPLLVHDQRRGQYWLVGSQGHRTPTWLRHLQEPAPAWRGPMTPDTLVAGIPPPAYRRAVERILAYLAAGDAYQVNFTLPYSTRLDAPPWALHVRLATLAPSEHRVFLDLGDVQVVANTPELLLRRRKRLLETHPIKGTRPRGEDPVRDAALAAELAADPKERAEHVMIVDLERNDLGRVCETGSVAIHRLAEVRTAPTVHHLVTAVRGRLRADADLRAVLEATFPGGSITGAPKVRAMEIIAELEHEARDVYTGGIGLLDPRGNMELALPIRTAVVRDDRLTYRAGGGIVVDSVPERELAEAWVKTAAVRRALGEAPPAALDQCSSG